MFNVFCDCDMTPCSLVISSLRSVATCCLHLQVWSVFLYYPENRGRKVLRNADDLLPIDTAEGLTLLRENVNSHENFPLFLYAGNCERKILLKMNFMRYVSIRSVLKFDSISLVKAETFCSDFILRQHF